MIEIKDKAKFDETVIRHENFYLGDFAEELQAHIFTHTPAMMLIRNGEKNALHCSV